MLHAQTIGNFRILEVFVTLDDEAAINSQVQAQPKGDLTYAEHIGGPSASPPKDSLLMSQAHN
jgi:hypothetical protein